MNILLTGATGTLGSRILFSLFEQKFERIKKVFLMVRKKTGSTPEQRIQNMLTSTNAPDFIQRNSRAILKKIKVIDAQNMLKPSTFLSGENIDYFIHSAGYVNLSIKPEAKSEVFKENFEFTKAIFKTYNSYISKFIYVSTAFSSGDVGGLLTNNYNNYSGNYRNHYEASKHASEQFLQQACLAKNVKLQILRPSVLGGNIKETPNYFISKYMVFYLFAKFFHNNTSSTDAVRIRTNTNTGLNIIPTDYAANVITKVFDTDISELNIVHAQETNMMLGISKILNAVGYTNFTFTEEPITAETGFISKLEKYYYETIGVHLNPYMTSKSNEWDTELLQRILPLPHYDLEDYLLQTISFAKAANFKNQKW